ncbi:unnamed protein product [Malus baccata var. baccata]
MCFAIDVAEKVIVPVMAISIINGCGFWSYSCIPNLIQQGHVPFLEAAIKELASSETQLASLRTQIDNLTSEVEEQRAKVTSTRNIHDSAQSELNSLFPHLHRDELQKFVGALLLRTRSEVVDSLLKLQQSLGFAVRFKPPRLPPSPPQVPSQRLGDRLSPLRLTERFGLNQVGAPLLSA